MTAYKSIDPKYPGGYRAESPFDLGGVDDNYFLSSDGFDKEFRQRQPTRCKLLLKQGIFFIVQAKRYLM